MKKGKFLSLEGVDGAGKSTHQKFIADSLATRAPHVIQTRERLAGKSLDRFERADRAFFERVRAAYLARARAEPARVRVIDATAQLPEIRKAIEHHLADL
jgi:thymidylate kinase